MNHLVIELTNKCNLKCKMCGVRDRRYFDSLPIEVVKRLVDEAQEIHRIKRISFHGLGEPLLYPEVTEAVSYAKSKGFYVGFVTNGVFLDSEKAESLLDAGIDYITISLNGIRNEIYSDFQGYDLGSDVSERNLRKVIKNVKNFLEIRDRKKSRCMVKLSYLLTSKSKEHYKEYLRFWKKTGHKMMVTAIQLSRWKYDENTKYTRCEHINKDFMVLANGRITYCGCDQLLGGHIGNVYKGTLMDALSGERFKAIEEAHRRMDIMSLPEECLRCEQMMDKGFLRNYSVAYRIDYLNDIFLNVKWHIILWGYIIFSELKKHRITFPIWQKVTTSLLAGELHN